ncbi:hypothetical protein M409DRAFT_19222 [Zasmidium cellare ATCC 36951]|uniref:Uncharacterized protein n=1 Tax=Zasmidium cellare ATCC 36951 TaxID=1080233 RepID=A0A6A6CW26_ZASCE|nr:uncharacterized protein M409DRAFT_19222 [Zasmidium cellare ATCC 36951]KAF2170400.1 hypothetical protein M409DRAFT_19222 [Zasmidium cellare ATCC 36951]
MATPAVTGTSTPTTIHGPLGTALTYLWTHRSPVISYGLDRVEAYDAHIQTLQIALWRAEEIQLRQHLVREWYHFSKRRLNLGADRGAGDHVAMLEGTVAEREEVQGVVGVARGLYEGGMRVLPPKSAEGERAEEAAAAEAPPAEPVKRGRGTPKGSKTKKRKVDGEWVPVPGLAAPEEGKERKEGAEGKDGKKGGGEPPKPKNRGRPPKEGKEVFEGPKRGVGRPRKHPLPEGETPPAKKTKKTPAPAEQTPGYPTPLNPPAASTPQQQPPPIANHQPQTIPSTSTPTPPAQAPAPAPPPAPLPLIHLPTNTEPPPTWPPPELSHDSPLKNPYPWLPATDFHGQQPQALPGTPPRRRHPREDAAAVVADKEELERPSSLLEGYFRGEGERFEGLFGGRVRVGEGGEGWVLREEDEGGWMPAPAPAQPPPPTIAPSTVPPSPRPAQPSTATRGSITFRLDIFSTPPTTGSGAGLLLDAPSPRTIPTRGEGEEVFLSVEEDWQAMVLDLEKEFEEFGWW